MFITMFTKASHPSLSWALQIHSTLFQPISLRSILITFSHLRLGLPRSFFLSGFPTKPYRYLLSSPMRATCPADLILHNLICLTIWRWVQIMKLTIVQLSPFSRYFIPLRSKYSPHHPVLKHPILCSFLNTRNQVSKTCKTTGRIAVLCILTFTLLESRREDRRLWTEGQQPFPELFCS
jgi:hypothetical protein